MSLVHKIRSTRPLLSRSIRGNTTLNRPNLDRFLSSHAEVVVVGAGLAGLTLARVLQVHGIPVKVYERDLSDMSRDQGGSLDVSIDGGQFALHEAGLFEQFDAACNRMADTMRMLDKRGVVHFDDKDISKTVQTDGNRDLTAEEKWRQFRGGDRPEIDRGVLRKLFLDGLRPGTVKWGRSVSSVTSNRNPSTGLLIHSLHFSDGTIEKTFGVLVGADGAWSRVRPLLSPVKPSYTGITMIECHIHGIDKLIPRSAELLGDGTMTAIAKGRMLFVQRNSHGRARVYIFAQEPQSWHKSVIVPEDSPVENRARLLAELDGWHPDLRAIVEFSDEKYGFIPRELFTLPEDHSWPHMQGITIIGDAAHLMFPNGEGANLAMADGARLGLALGKVYKGEGTLDEELAAFEKDMFRFAQEKAAAADPGAVNWTDNVREMLSEYFQSP